MACFRPVQISDLVWFKRGGEGIPPKVRCNTCVGCRLDRSRMWALRCMHESQMHELNCAVTLTYSDDYLPFAGDLNYRHFQLFMKKVRKRFGKGVRFYMCGEYGERFGRPHYHSILFGMDFPDKVLCGKSGSGQDMYSSEILDSCWSDKRRCMGRAVIGDVSFDTAAYIARYIFKKVLGSGAWYYYTDVSTGLVRTPEFTNMSRRSGIGKSWLDKFAGDVYPHDYCLVRDDFKVKPPRFYDSKFELLYPNEFALVKEKRQFDAIDSVDNTPERLLVREKVALAKLSRSSRSYERDGN